MLKIKCGPTSNSLELIDADTGENIMPRLGIARADVVVPLRPGQRTTVIMEIYADDLEILTERAEVVVKSEKPDSAAPRSWKLEDLEGSVEALGRKFGYFETLLTGVYDKLFPGKKEKQG